MIRAFIAVDIPEAVRAAIGEGQAGLKRAHVGVKISWTKVANIHITLQFLGYVEETAVEKINAALESVSRNHAPFDLNIRGAGVFPNENRPRVLWVGCEDAEGKLKDLATAVQSSLQPLGFEPEHREFSAHLTLGRVKFPRPDAALTRALDSIKNEDFGTMRVEAMHLFESQLHPQGSIYSKLSSHKLGEGHHAAKN
ncbi:MAG TPA: RNA 2',3'-cyclic phosphodiesterase [Verrucomicrobiae bacterium]|nr:RNA 2',3'-cyclic phosphodiesterase [Verrucomicrobiae bacterium]